MRICFVGDNMVNGTGDPDYLGWVGRVLQDERKRRTELTGYNLGIRRDRSDQIRARWRAEVATAGRVRRPGGLLLWQHDAVQKIEPAQMLAHTEAILSEAKKRWPIFMVGVIPVSADDVRARCRSLDLAFARLCDRLGVPFLSVFEGLIATPAWLDEARAGDGAHPGTGGYGRMTEVVLGSKIWQQWMALSPTP
jgi:lysophospholipase L1-like esterase